MTETDRNYEIWRGAYSDFLRIFLRHWRDRDIVSMEALSPYLDIAQSRAIGWASRP